MSMLRGDRVLLERRRLNLNQKVLADQIGVDQTYISRIERDQDVNVGIKTIQALAEALGVMAPSQRETPARVVPTWTNTPVPPTATLAATETATLLPTATPVPTETPIPAPVVEERAAPVLVLPTATAEVAGEPVCEIKGNVNSDGERIYHKPGWRDYNKVVMKAEEGDTWFCSDADAQAAGFRPAQQ